MNLDQIRAIEIRAVRKFAHTNVREFQYCANLNTIKVIEIYPK